MSLRRCPGCHNMVERASVVCPVCGGTWGAILLARAIRWAVILLLVAFIAYEVIRHQAQARRRSSAMGVPPVGRIETGRPVKSGRLTVAASMPRWL